MTKGAASSLVSRNSLSFSGLYGKKMCPWGKNIKSHKMSLRLHTEKVITARSWGHHPTETSKEN